MYQDDIDEREINPEECWGQYYRVPHVLGYGSGRGFGFENLAIPRRWEEALPTMTHDHFRMRFEQWAHRSAGTYGFTIATVGWGEEGLLRSVSLQEGNCCCMYLNPSQFGLDSLCFHTHNVDHLTQATCLFEIGVRYINEMLDRIYREKE